MTVDSELWSSRDTDIIARAVVEAPSIHNTQPWHLRLVQGAVELDERTDFAGPEPDPTRPDRLISCGTALANLELAMQVLGHRTRIDLFPDPDRPSLVARITPLGSSTPTSSDLRLYAAISHRRSHRDRFADITVPAETLCDVVAAGTRIPDVTVRLLASDESAVLADMLVYSSQLERFHPHYRRAMFSWTSHWQPRGNDEVVTTWTAALDEQGPAGEALITNGIPDRNDLSDAIEREAVLVFSAPTSEPADLVRIGMASERIWLAAVDARLSASVLTQPLRVEDSAQRLAARLGTTGTPELIMRIGY